MCSIRSSISPFILCALSVSIFNMFLVVAQGSGVLDIFYDCLALQFLQILDNIAFSIAKMGTFGKRLKWATNKKLFGVEFDKPPYAARREISLFVKILYIANLSAMFGGMIYVSILQGTGALNCPSVQVTFPDVSFSCFERNDLSIDVLTHTDISSKDIWQNAVIVSDAGEVLRGADLIYSFFNGVYKRNGTHDGLPGKCIAG